MSSHELIEICSRVEIVSCTLALAFMCFRRQLGRYIFLTSFLAVRLLSDTLLYLLQQAGGFLSAQQAYHTYFYIYWSSYAVEAVLGFGIIYSIFRLAMAPLKGLQSLGNVMFKWAFGIAAAISLSVGLSAHTNAVSLIVRAFSQLQQTESVLTLCMLLFVCMAIRPMGLSHRSKIFGVSLGLGILATCDLTTSAFGTDSLNSLFEVFKGCCTCLAFSTWVVYFALPEPKRRMVLLPTTSPFLRWNQIAQVLNDEPGFVAVGEVTPEMFAPAELEIMRRASANMERALANG